jgi:hypothetical protein
MRWGLTSRLDSRRPAQWYKLTTSAVRYGDGAWWGFLLFSRLILSTAENAQNQAIFDRAECICLERPDQAGSARLTLRRK